MKSVSLARLTAVLALAVSGLAVPAAPASANDGMCQQSDFCLWENPNLSGGRWDDRGAVISYASGNRYWGTTVTVNDTSSSVWNRLNTAMALCEHAWFLGAEVYVGPGLVINYLSDYEFQDRASSNYW
jgi:hypothetical protein